MSGKASNPLSSLWLNCGFKGNLVILHERVAHDASRLLLFQDDCIWPGKGTMLKETLNK
jgi:hypothetical protein